LIASAAHRADPSFLGVSPQVTLVINLTVGYRYFPPGRSYFSSQTDHARWPVQYQIILLGDRDTQL